MPKVSSVSRGNFFISYVQSRDLTPLVLGKKGVIKGLPHYGVTSSGTKTWLCDLSCDNGQEITLPFNNLRAIE